MEIGLITAGFIAGMAFMGFLWASTDERNMKDLILKGGYLAGSDTIGRNKRVSGCVEVEVSQGVWKKVE